MKWAAEQSDRANILISDPGGSSQRPGRWFLLNAVRFSGSPVLPPTALPFSHSPHGLSFSSLPPAQLSLPIKNLSLLSHGFNLVEVTKWHSHLSGHSVVFWAHKWQIGTNYRYLVHHVVILNDVWKWYKHGSIFISYFDSTWLQMVIKLVLNRKLWKGKRKVTEKVRNLQGPMSLFKDFSHHSYSEDTFKIKFNCLELHVSEGYTFIEF